MPRSVMKARWMAVAPVSGILALALILPVGRFGLTDGLAADGLQVVRPAAPIFGRNGYIEYDPGDLPIVLSVPHGGTLRPEEIPDRIHELTDNDWGVLEFARQVGAEIERIAGRRPHLIINHLDRLKLDPNRSEAEAAVDNPWAVQAWREYHAFIVQAEASAVQQCGRGHYFDLHSNGQEGFLIQLGFGLTLAELDQPDKALDRPSVAAHSSLRRLATSPGNTLSQLIRGELGLGALLKAVGYRVIPSATEPVPTVDPYFNGGYSIRAHGSQVDGWIDATQVEVSYELLRENFRARLARALAQAIVDFVDARYGFRLSDRSGSPICPTFADVPFSDASSMVVERLSRLTVLEPCSQAPRMFCPQAGLTRGELAVMLEHARSDPGAPVSLTRANPFGDLAPGYPSAPWIAAAWADGLVEACATEPLEFCAGREATRAEAVEWSYHLTGQPAPVASGLFADVPGLDPHAGAIEAANRLGWIAACASTPVRRFCPQQVVTRAEAAAIVAGALLARADRLAARADR